MKTQICCRPLLTRVLCSWALAVACAFVFMPTEKANAKQPSPTCDEACYDVQLDSVENANCDEANGVTVFTYKVTALETHPSSGGNCQDISHWVLGFGNCDDVQSATVKEIDDPETGCVNPDPTTQVTGLKYNDGQPAASTYTYYVTMPGCWCTGEGTAAVKAGLCANDYSVGVPVLDEGGECDGQGQLCGAAPVSLAIMLDRTGSVSSAQRTAEANFAKDILDYLASLNNGSKVALGRFAAVTCGAPGSPDPAGAAQIFQTLTTVTPANVAGLKTLVSTNMSNSSCSGTNLKDSIEKAQAQVVGQTNPIITLLSDGDPQKPCTPNEPCTDDNVADEAAAYTFALNAANTAKANGITILTIAFDASGSGDDASQNRPLLAAMATQPSDDDPVGSVDSTERSAENSDGDYFFIATTQSELDEVFDKIEQVLTCNDNNPCTVDTCDTSQNPDSCVFTLIPDCQPCDTNTDCDDGNACNGTETCSPGGTCVAGTPLTCNDGDACTTDSCNPASGCVTTPVDCSDNNPCTDDSCDSVNGCQHIIIPGCQPCNNNNDCDNANACDGQEFCGQDGVCHAGTPPDCVDENLCTQDACNPATGCTFTNINCNDTNACTTDSCVPLTGCQYAPVNCDDTDACTSDTCDSASGCTHSSVSCDDSNPCTSDSCDSESGCLNVPIPGCIVCTSNSDCNDGNACNGVEICGPAGFCLPGLPPNCDDSDACTTDSCVAPGGCVNTPVVCNDGNACTDDDCDPASGCTTSPVDCNDNSQCTNDSCDPDDGCQYSAVDCDDTDTCTADTCDPLSGCDHATISCDDGDPCTTDTCGTSLGCSNSPIPGCIPCESNDDCDNGNACDGVETCGPGGTCIPGTAPNCNDSNACTNDSCQPALGCVYAGVSCDDSDACTNDTCDTATGCDHSAVTCNDGDACTTDSCDPASGCTTSSVTCNDNNPCTTDSCDSTEGCIYTTIVGCITCESNEDCTNNNVCDGQEYCDDNGVCASGTPLDCNDGNDCTNDSCDPQTGCQYSTVVCDDNSACTDDTCNPASGCQFSPISCDDSNACTSDTCDPVAGCISNPINCNDGNPCTTDSCDTTTGCQNTFIQGCQVCASNDDCNDSNPCNGQETCQNNVCASGSALDCNDDNLCTADSCDLNSGCVHVSLVCNDNSTCTNDACNLGTGQCDFVDNGTCPPTDTGITGEPEPDKPGVTEEVGEVFGVVLQGSGPGNRSAAGCFSIGGGEPTAPPIGFLMIPALIGVGITMRLAQRKAFAAKNGGRK